MLDKIVFGVDVSKAQLDYICLPGGKPARVANTPVGVKGLISKIKKTNPDLVILEATGGYQNLLVEQLHNHSVPVKVVNPRQVRDFARSHNQLAKTDKLDALILAEFALSRELEPDLPSDPDRRFLSALQQRRRQLVDMLTLETGHLEHTPVEFQEGLLAHIAFLKDDISNLEKQIKATVKNRKDFAAQDEIMQSIPGVGCVVSTTIIAELPEITQVNRKQIAALVGVAPFNRDSGRYRGQRHIWSGRKKVRHAMYAAMRACLLFNPVIKGWFERFRAAGKAYKVAVIACVRKLLLVIRAMLISGTKWQENKLIA